MKKNIKKPNLRKLQAEDRKRQILYTALNIIGERGFKETSIKDIAQAAGISQGLLYHYFASKEDLLKGIIENFGFLGKLRQILSDVNDLPVEDVFRKIAAEFLGVLDNEQMMVRILTREVFLNSEVEKAWADLCHSGVALIQNYLDQHIRNGDLKPHNAEVIARAVFGMFFMYHFTRDVFDYSPVSRDQFVDEAVKILLRGIAKT